MSIMGRSKWHFTRAKRFVFKLILHIGSSLLFRWPDTTTNTRGVFIFRCQVYLLVSLFIDWVLTKCQFAFWWWSFRLYIWLSSRHSKLGHTLLGRTDQSDHDVQVPSRMKGTPNCQTLHQYHRFTKSMYIYCNNFVLH